MRGLITLLLGVCLFTASAQGVHEGLDYTTSPTFKPRWGKLGYVRDILGYTDDAVYVLLTNSQGTAYKYSRKAWIQKIDRKTMKEVSKVEILGGKGRKFKLEEVILTSSGIVVVRKNLSRKTVTVYGETWSMDLEQTQPMRELVSYDRKSVIMSVKSDIDWDFFVIATQDFTFERVKVDYNIYRSNLSMWRSGQLPLDLKLTGRNVRARVNQGTLLGDLHPTQDGNFNVVTEVRRQVSNGDDGYNIYINHFDTETREKKDIAVELGGEAYIRRYSFFERSGKIYIAGFYSDPTMEMKRVLFDWGTEQRASRDVGGTFLAEIDFDQSVPIRVSKQPLSEEFIKEVEGNNPQIKDKKDSEENYGDYVISNSAINVDTKELWLYCEYAENYRVVTSTNNSTSTRYYSKRGNLFVTKFNLETGKVAWVRSVPKKNIRTSRYSSVWTTRTITAFPNLNGGDHLVGYYTDRIYDPHNWEENSKFKYSDYLADFMLAYFDNETGQSEVFLPPLAEKKTKEYERLSLEWYYRDSENSEAFLISTKNSIRPVRFTILTIVNLSFIGTVPGLIISKRTKDRKYKQTYTISKLDY